MARREIRTRLISDASAIGSAEWRHARAVRAGRASVIAKAAQRARTFAAGGRISVGCPTCGWRGRRRRRQAIPSFGMCPRARCHAALVDTRPWNTPAWRHARSLKAGRAAAVKRIAEREAKCVRYATKGVAYQAGYRQGYTSASAWWRHKLARELGRARRAS